jgi:hypothetical protein
LTPQRPNQEPIALLLGKEPVEAGREGIAVTVLVTQGFERVPGHVGGRLVGDLAEIADREPIEPESLVVDVEGAPTPTPRLHSDHPVEPAPDRGVAETELA